MLKPASRVLAQIAQLIGGAMRDSDIVAHTGPFEITIALTATDITGAIEVSERLRVNPADTLLR